jgi:hypothetical protein
MGCPATDCRAASPQQRSLTPGERATMGNPEWSGQAQRCTYCGCVYSQDKYGRPTIEGWYDSMLGPGWKPRRRT